jgi:CBS domain-containing protein
VSAPPEIVESSMTKRPITIAPQQTCERALVLMDAASIDHLPVCDGARVVGLLTRAKMLERAENLLGRGSDRDEARHLLPFLQVAGMMALAPQCVSPETPLSSAADLMHSVGVSALPVVADHELVGILTFRDLTRSPGPPRHGFDRR